MQLADTTIGEVKVSLSVEVADNFYTLEVLEFGNTHRSHYHHFQEALRNYTSTVETEI